MARKSTKGRQKLPIAKMEKKSNLQVTFSRRRNGLFKKASELCTLTGAEVALVVFSPGQKAYSFGHPNFQAVVDKYLGKTPSPTNSTIVNENPIENAAGHDQLNKELSDAEKCLEVEKERGEVLYKTSEKRQPKYWWEAPFDYLNLAGLHNLEKVMKDLRKNVVHEEVVRRQNLQEMNMSRNLFDMNIFGGNNNNNNNVAGPSNTKGVSFGPRASAGPSGGGGLSPFGAMVVDSSAKIDLNARFDDHEAGGGSNMAREIEPQFRKFF
ncbi:hypothetical protein ACH5RR_022294 [Cinchona calisaya]|uniref:MADS-box domain-containing protein n=1 Tax=Cinchona calisaya TaxID=153742 RepID=A0ABD2ZAL0_9GENT